MPVYRGERFIAAAIESVLAQTYREFELVVVNDGSPDRSAEAPWSSSRFAAPLGILALAGTFQFGYAVSKPPRIDLKLSAQAR